MTVTCVPPQLGPFCAHNRRSAAVSHTAVSATCYNKDCKGFPASPCLCGSGGLMCACGARWTLSWEHECGLFCRLHLGLHMVQQTAVREAGGHVGRAPLQRARLHLYWLTGHRCKWQHKRWWQILQDKCSSPHKCLSPSLPSCVAATASCSQVPCRRHSPGTIRAAASCSRTQ